MPGATRTMKKCLVLFEFQMNIKQQMLGRLRYANLLTDIEFVVQKANLNSSVFGLQREFSMIRVCQSRTATLWSIRLDFMKEF